MVSDAERKLYSSLITSSAMLNSSIQPLHIKDEDFLNHASHYMKKKTGNERFEYKVIDDIPQEVLEIVIDELKAYVELDIKIVDRVTNPRAKARALEKYPDSFMTMENFIKEYPNEYKAWKNLY